MRVQKKFAMYKNIEVQIKVLLIKDQKCIILWMKQKGKIKKDREGRLVIVKKYKSFVKSKRIFWKQWTDAKSLFAGITEIRMDEFIEMMKEHNLETLGLFV